MLQCLIQLCTFGPVVAQEHPSSGLGASHGLAAHWFIHMESRILLCQSSRRCSGPLGLISIVFEFSSLFQPLLRSVTKHFRLNVEASFCYYLYLWKIV